MFHEGATKEVLVTTSSYCKESYDFSKDKPIALIDEQVFLILIISFEFTIKI